MELGQKVIITAVLERRYSEQHSKAITDYRSTNGKAWVRRELPKPIEGIWVGWRTLSNGGYVWDEDGSRWYADKDGYIRGELVVYAPRSKSLVVPSDAMKVVS